MQARQMQEWKICRRVMEASQGAPGRWSRQNAHRAPWGLSQAPRGDCTWCVPIAWQALEACSVRSMSSFAMGHAGIIIAAEVDACASWHRAGYAGTCMCLELR